MNFIKTSKFSVKGIDTTRYISNEVRNLLFNRKGVKSPLQNRHEVSSRTPFVRDLRLIPQRDFKFIRGVFWGVLFTPLNRLRRGTFPSSIYRHYSFKVFPKHRLKIFYTNWKCSIKENYINYSKYYPQFSTFIHRFLWISYKLMS